MYFSQSLSFFFSVDTSTTQLSPLRSLSLPTPVHHSNLCSPPSSPILPSPFPTTSPYPYAVPDITTIPGTSQRLRQPPMLSSFIPTSFLTPTETAAVAMYPSVNTSSSGMSAITGSPRIQPALPTGSHLLPSSLHLPTAVPSPITVQPAPSISSHSTNISPASNLPPDAFELPRDPELFSRLGLLIWLLTSIFSQFMSGMSHFPNYSVCCCSIAGSQVKGVYYDDTSNRYVNIIIHTFQK